MNNTDIKTFIRPLAASDYQAWLELYQHYAAHYHMELSEAGIATTWQWLMDEAHPVTGIVACLPAPSSPDTSSIAPTPAIIGLAHYRAMPSPLRGKEVGFLDDLIVHPHHRGGATASMLLEELKQITQQRGWGVMRWITQENNYRARNVYDKTAHKSHWLTYEMTP